jgi:diguanylate cyclase (GGDEF)-like protein
MDMLGMRLGGYEMSRDDDFLYVTENYFALLGMDDVSVSDMSISTFQELSQQINRTLIHTNNEDGSILYQIRCPQCGVRYVRLEIYQEGALAMGLAEDVTRSTKDRLRIEHERDYDLLTDLLNRRSFYSQAKKLFQHPEQLGHAALLMMDLDHLKQINDQFGHDLGDQYIRAAAQSFAKNSPPETLCARVSGDEFFLMFYGYPDRQTIRRHLQQLSAAIQSSTFTLPTGESVSIAISCGVSWYPEDSTDFHLLMKYADFAMYQSKRARQGEMKDFDPESYDEEAAAYESSFEWRQRLD